VGNKEKFLEAGMDDFIEKPVEMEILVATLKQYLTKLSEGHQQQELQDYRQQCGFPFVIDSDWQGKESGRKTRLTLFLNLLF
jgi:DNA-binding response OmpR family regulator